MKNSVNLIFVEAKMDTGIGQARWKPVDFDGKPSLENGNRFVGHPHLYTGFSNSVAVGWRRGGRFAESPGFLAVSEVDVDRVHRPDSRRFDHGWDRTRRISIVIRAVPDRDGHVWSVAIENTAILY